MSNHITQEQLSGLAPRLNKYFDLCEAKGLDAAAGLATVFFLCLTDEETERFLGGDLSLLDNFQQRFKDAGIEGLS